MEVGLGPVEGVAEVVDAAGVEAEAKWAALAAAIVPAAVLKNVLLE